MFMTLIPDRGSVSQSASDGVDGDAFVGGVGAAGPVERRHPYASGVVQADQPPSVVEDRAAGTATLGRRAIAQDALVVVEQNVVLKGELRLRRSAGMPDHVRPLVVQRLGG